MGYLKLTILIMLATFMVSNVGAQKVITGPKIIKEKEKNTSKGNESKTIPHVNRDSNRNIKVTPKKTGNHRLSQSLRVDYTRYNDGLVSAAEHGDVKACHCLGHLYDSEYGYNGVIPNQEMAIKWYTLAADKGDCCAQIDLVFHCLEWPQKSSAFETVRKYAEMGNVCMQSSLAGYYMNKFNYSDAIKWLRLAANNENVRDESYNDNGFPAQVEAWYALGKCYFEGLGVEKNASIGRMWMKKASNAGLDSATNYLEENK